MTQDIFSRSIISGYSSRNDFICNIAVEADLSFRTEAKGIVLMRVGNKAE